MLRLILAIVFLLLGLLCVFPAPEYHIWLISVLVTEFPWIFLIAVLAILVLGFAVRKHRKAGTVVCIAASVLFTYPIIGAYWISAKVAEGFEASFGKVAIPDKSHHVFSFKNMLAGHDKPVSYATNVYSTIDEVNLTLDYYRAEGATAHPCVIAIHGGSWCGGTSTELPELNSYLARIGYNVAAINYRLAPRFKWPLQIEDVKSAITYLKQHSKELNLDTANFVLMGRSAGGQIALSAAYLLPEAGLKGVIDLYGPADMKWGYYHPANPWVLDTRKIMEDYMGGSPETVPQNYAASSAIETATSTSVPTLMIFGKNDPLVPYENGVVLREKLNEKGVKNLLLLLPWATHGCDYTLHGPSGQLTTYTVKHFLRVVTGGSKY